MLLIQIVFLSAFSFCEISNSFSSKGIFVTVDYRGVDVRGYVSYSVSFFSLRNFIEIYKIPYQLFEDIRNINLGSSFRFKLYGQSFYIFRYIGIKNSVSNLKSSQAKDNNLPDSRDKDFFEFYFNDLKNNFTFYAFDIFLRGISPEYSSLKSTEKKDFIKDLNFLIEKIDPVSVLY